MPTTLRSQAILKNSGLRSVATVCGLFLSLVLSAAPRATEQAPLHLDDLFASPSLFGTVPSPPKWAPDSQRFAFTWNDKGLPDRELWLASADGKELRRLSSPQFALYSSTREFAWRSNSKNILMLRGNELWQLDIDDSKARRLGDLGPGASNLGLAPDDQKVAFLKDGNLWIFDLQTNSSSAITDIGIPGLSALSIGRYNRPEREIGPGIWGGPTYVWSPDSRTIAVHLVDRRQMRKVPFPDYLSSETAPNEIRRGYPGDANESRTVGLIDVAEGKLQLLPLQNTSANQVVGFSWSSKGVLLLDVASDTAEDRWLYTVDAQQRLKEVWHKQRKSRIYTSFASQWHPNGEDIIFLSDLEDRYGLYMIDALAETQSPRLLSNPEADVLSAPIMAGAGSIFYTANAPNASESQVFVIRPSQATAQRVTPLSGHSSGYPSPDASHVAFVHSNDTQPAEIYSVSTMGTKLHRVTHSPLEAFSEREWARSRYLSFPSGIDDYQLHARILEPATLDPEKKYPVLFGPMYSNTVRNRWGGVYNRVQQLLVQKGYIIVQVDMRGSTGYGRDFREEFLVDFAGDDIEDIVSTVEYLKTVPYMDTERMGIWGSSYGGTLSIYTLLKKPGLFRAGVAAAAAVDPHFFGTDDVAIVRRPDTHPEVFLNMAARYAANLEDHLLIIHGMQDQVVPFKTTATLADLLIKEGKDFDFAFAPGATHSWSRETHYSRYLFGKLVAHFDRYLMP
ncbi:prolyl oligopeptidase family serine peptidase [Congregibacter variabilis]|uniref:Prolyl oligopeptidase family serine peptidase n=1 Tax=Congregibacter variabilis TaxID=3081200 RepID=A0ABZ0HZX1_9GAMM|nr:prolyl oligopeptidase family serine peptidase [Congregibacter sp. IMCC43200]